MRNHAITIFFGSFISKVISFLYAPLIVYLLGPTIYGRFDYFVAIVLMLDTLLSFKISEAFFRYSVDEENINKRLELFNSVLKFLTIVYSISIIIFYMFGSYLYVLLVIFSYVKSLFILGVERERAYGSPTVYGICTIFVGISFLLGIFLCARYLDGVIGAKGLIYIQTLIYTTVVLFLAYRQKWKSLLKIRIFKTKLILSLLAFSLPLIPSAASWWIIKLSNRFFIEKGYDGETLGLFSIYSYLPTVIMTFGLVLYITLQKQIYSGSDRDVRRIIEFLFLSATSSSLFLLLITPLVLNWFFNLSEINHSLASLLLFNSGIFVMASSLALLYTKDRQTSKLMFSTVISAVIVCVCTYVSYQESLIHVALSATSGLVVMLLYRLVQYSGEITPNVLIAIFVLLLVVIFYVFFGPSLLLTSVTLFFILLLFARTVFLIRELL